MIFSRFRDYFLWFGKNPNSGFLRTLKNTTHVRAQPRPFDVLILFFLIFLLRVIAFNAHGESRAMSLQAFTTQPPLGTAKEPSQVDCPGSGAHLRRFPTLAAAAAAWLTPGPTVIGGLPPNPAVFTFP